MRFRVLCDRTGEGTATVSIVHSGGKVEWQKKEIVRW